MKNYICKVEIQFNDRLNKEKLMKVGKPYKCDRKRYEELKTYNAIRLLKIEKKK